MQRLGDQPLADEGTVAVSGVNEVHADLRHALQHADRLGPVLGLAPYARAGDAHRTEAEAVDDDIAPDGELAGKAGVDLGHDIVPLELGRGQKDSGLFSQTKEY